MILQSDHVVPQLTPPPLAVPTSGDASATVVRFAGDASAAVVRSSTPPSLALELQAIGVREAFKAKPSDIAALEVGHKGTAFMCVCRSARLTTKCCEWSFALLTPHRHLPIKVVPRWRSAYPRLCCLRLIHGGASFGHYCFAPPAPSDHVGCCE
jgi:hypothetical protein